MRNPKKDVTPSVRGKGLQSKSQNSQTENEYSIHGTGPAATSHEDWIRRLGVEVEISMKHGRRSQAYGFMRMMYAAIRIRLPAQQHRRFMEIDAAIWGCP